MGKIRAPYYRIVVADSRTKRDGRVIEEIGKYHPTEEPSVIEVDSARAQYWLGVGAQPTGQVEAILKLTGDWGTFKGQKNAKNTVKVKEAKAAFVVDEKKKAVLKPKAETPVAKTGKTAPAADESAAAATGDDQAAEKAVDSSVSSQAATAEAPETPVTEAPAAETPAAEAPVEADAAAAEVAAAAVEESPGTVQETSEQVDNSDAAAAAAPTPDKA